MKIMSKLNGEIDISQEKIIHFSEGILGFPDFHDFVLIDREDEYPFLWLQSTEDPKLAFVVIKADSIFASYQPDCPQGDIKKLGLKQITEVQVYCIITIPDNPEAMTANLQGPILINPNSRTGIQSISLNEKHSVRKALIETSPAQGGL